MMSCVVQRVGAGAPTLCTCDDVLCSTDRIGWCFLTVCTVVGTW